jgi:hypothetical protein
MTYFLMCLACLVVWIGGAVPARACSGSYSTDRAALPRTGATDVSTNTSIVVLSRTEPFDLQLRANGESVPINGWTPLGSGRDEQLGPTSYWRLRAPLQPASTYALSSAAASTDGGDSEITQFSTGPGYDKTPGTAPTLRALRLWRVRYPVSAIGGGACVFSEYHGFITVDYDPAVIPNTEATSVVHTFRLVPKTGGLEQTFVYTGSDAFSGYAPSGDYYPPSFSSWQPELDPSREYCLTIEAFGDADLARQTPTSNQVCARVTELAAKGASQDGAGGGCSASPGIQQRHLPAVLIALLLTAIVRRRRVG